MLLGVLNPFWIAKWYILYQQINAENKPIWSLHLQGSCCAWGTLQPLCLLSPQTIFRETLRCHCKSDCYLSTNTSEHRQTVLFWWDTAVPGFLPMAHCVCTGVCRASILWENTAPRAPTFLFSIVHILHRYYNWHLLCNPAAGLKRKQNWRMQTPPHTSTATCSQTATRWTGQISAPSTQRGLTVPLNCRQEKMSHWGTKWSTSDRMAG